MLSTVVLAVSISFAASMAPQKQVRVAHDSEPVSMSVQSDGSILKVEDSPKTTQARVEPKKTEKKLEDPLVAMHEMMGTNAKEMAAVEKRFNEERAAMHQESKARGATIKEVKEKKDSAVQKDATPAVEIKAHKEGEIKPHIAATEVGDVALHKNPSKAKSSESTHVQLATPLAAEEGHPVVDLDKVMLFEMAASDPEESWKSAFFFFASLVLIVVLVGAVISALYFNREQAAKNAGAERSLLAKEPQGAAALQAQLNDSSSTSDSGEKIAMLFDRVRKSLEDLSDKTPAEQADMAGGQSAPAVNTL